MCIHAGAAVNDSRAVVQPIYQTSAFRFDSTGHGAALFAAGLHAVCSQVVYGPTLTLLNTVYKRFGITVDFVDTSDTKQVIGALKPKTRLVYVETPGNPTIDLSDIKKIAAAAHEVGAVLAVDNTFLSPWFQNPLIIGADIVLHSLTKFINGHADVIGGIVVVKDDDTYRSMIWAVLKP